MAQVPLPLNTYLRVTERMRKRLHPHHTDRPLVPGAHCYGNRLQVSSVLCPGNSVVGGESDGRSDTPKRAEF